MKTGAMMKRTKKMSGKTSNPITLQALFNRQMANQARMFQDGMYDAFKSEGTDMLPVDDIKLMSYHIQQLMSEIGEVLEADKRWKNIRNKKYCKTNKLEEIADCFIVLMNIAMFSGFGGDELQQAILDKINEVSRRLQNESFGI